MQSTMRFVRIARLSLQQFRVRNCEPTQLDRTTVLLQDVPCFHTREARPARDYSGEPPLNWTSHSHGIQLEGSARGRVATLRSLSSVDETKIPGPAVPVWRDQLKSLLFPVGIPVFERMRLLEHDDRQVSLPTPFSVMTPIGFVTNFFKSHESRGDVSLASHNLGNNACR